MVLNTTDASQSNEPPTTLSGGSVAPIASSSLRPQTLSMENDIRSISAPLIEMGSSSPGSNPLTPQDSDEDQGINSNIEAFTKMSLNDGNSQPMGIPIRDRDSRDLESACQSPFHLPTTVTQNILENLSSGDLQHFALSSKQSYIAALPILFRNVKLPLSDHQTTLGSLLGIEAYDYVQTATVDISDQVFHTAVYPGDRKIRKTLQQLPHLKHLVIKKSPTWASDAVLGSLLLFLVEQNTLEQLTMDLTFSNRVPGVKSFKERLTQSWLTIHRGAFHSNQRQLTTLNIKISNPKLEDDGLKGVQQLWMVILPTVRKLKLDLREVPVPEPALDRANRWVDYLHMTSSSGILDLEVEFHESVKWPYTEIGFQFPKVERLKVGFWGQNGSRPSIELSGLGRMSYLRSVDLPWAYDAVITNDTSPSIVGTIYSKAKERAKEVVGAKTQPESKEEKLKIQIRKQTGVALAIQRLTSIKDVTWRYKSEETGEETPVRFMLHWTGTEPHLTEMKS
ncbi:hypothetical protein TWF718_003778 [Orbilia javanica]|uniref:F-box domain-containing protein n=1 Tax=Orbilia javanica TaxID=47235 RepID=A0AAN8RK82_9PEZI